MTTNRILVTAVEVSFVAFPAMAQTSPDGVNNGHHYSGGPKTEVPHHMGKRDTVGVSTKSGEHHYNGGPSTSVPHHMGDKQ